MDLMFKDVDVHINKTEILHKVCGLVKQGEMLAVMGPSGAGKSTLLNVLAGRTELTDGQVTLNSQPMTKQLRRKVAYVLQQDVFFTNLTLKETLTYSAFLRLPDKMPHHLKTQRVKEIIDILQLDKCKNTIMGNAAVQGLSGGEKKRATIAVELLTNPLVLLLDEPTSGLDYAIAYDLMQIMNDYTHKTNKTVVVTIHQPSSQIFHLFTQLLLMCNGKTAYFGKAGDVLDYFSKVGLHCSLHYNPADFIVEKVKKNPEITQNILNYAEKCRQTDWPLELRQPHVKPKNEKKNPLDLIGRVRSSVSFEPLGNEKRGSKYLADSGYVNGGYSNDHTTIPEIAVEGAGNERLDKTRMSIVETDLQMELFQDRDCKWPTGFFTQYRVLTIRTMKQARHRILSKIAVVQSIIVTLYCSLLWFQMDRHEQTLSDRRGFLFFSIVYWGFIPLMDAVAAFPEERPVINRERAAGTYRLSAYYMAKMTSELPLIAILPVSYSIVVYWSINLMPNIENFLVFTGIHLLFALSMQGYGILVGCAILDTGRALTTGLVSFLLFMLAGGYYQQNLHDWAISLKYISIVHYVYNILLEQEFAHGDPLTCLPSNQTFFETCHNDTIVSGKEVLETLDIVSKWINYLVFVIFFFVTRIGGYFVLRYIRKPT